MLDDRELRRQDRKTTARLNAQEAARKDFIRASMGLRQGREYFYWLLGITNLNANPFTSNALTTAFNCGEANVGQQVRDHLIAVSPDHYLTMLKEKEDERLDSLRDTPTGDGDDEPADE